MSPSVSNAINAVLDFLKETPADQTFHPYLFTSTGHRSGMPHAIRRLKKAGVIEVAYRNFEGQPNYKKGPDYDDRLSILNFI